MVAVCPSPVATVMEVSGDEVTIVVAAGTPGAVAVVVAVVVVVVVGRGPGAGAGAAVSRVCVAAGRGGDTLQSTPKNLPILVERETADGRARGGR